MTYEHDVGMMQGLMLAMLAVARNKKHPQNIGRDIETLVLNLGMSIAEMDTVRIGSKRRF
jgi:hypothetical protein